MSISNSPTIINTAPDAPKMRCGFHISFCGGNQTPWPRDWPSRKLLLILRAPDRVLFLVRFARHIKVYILFSIHYTYSTYIIYLKYTVYFFSRIELVYVIYQIILDTRFMRPHTYIHERVLCHLINGTSKKGVKIGLT